MLADDKSGFLDDSRYEGSDQITKGSGWILADQEVVSIAIESLSTSDSPRLDGESPEHVRVLAESDVRLPPIVVHRSGMRVIDGMHRVRAAMLRGAREIEAVLFDGDDKDAFVLAVQMNVAHGLPLPLADRKAAAARIIGSYPNWSNRAIASTTGLSARTVATIRRCPSGYIVQSDTRVGRDGRVRPLNRVEGRRAASEMIKEFPDASLRDIARMVGISPETVRDVRTRMSRGEDPLTSQHRGVKPTERISAERVQGVDGRPVGATFARQLAQTLWNLRTDRSFLAITAGRLLIRVLDMNVAVVNDCSKLLDHVPPHCVGAVASAARQCAVTWSKFAGLLDRRINDTSEWADTTPEKDEG